LGDTPDVTLVVVGAVEVERMGDRITGLRVTVLEAELRGDHDVIARAGVHSARTADRSELHR
jgi:hypothetical protein